MSDNKKYYYLKLKDNFFDSDEMIVLESMDDGYIYSNILLKLYLRSLKHEGRLMFNERIPFNARMLAKVTRHSVGNIEKAIQTFVDLGLLEVLDNGAIYVSDIHNFIGTSSTEADRQREYRQRIKKEKESLLLESTNVTSNDKVNQSSNGVTNDTSFDVTNVENPTNDVTNVTKKEYECPDKSTPEIELEIDIELEKEIELQQHTGVWSSVETFQKLWLFPNDIQKDFLVEMIDKYSDELVDAAIKIAGSKDVPKNRALAFVEACLTEWTNANVRTVEDAREYTRRRATQSKQSYGRPVRKETLPEWAENPQVEDDKQVDPAVEARLKAYLEKQERERLERDAENG